MMKYELLFLDVDNALSPVGSTMTKRTYMALLKVQQLGVRLVLISEKNEDELITLSHRLSLDIYSGYVFSFQGRRLIELQTNEVVPCATLSSAINVLSARLHVPTENMIFINGSIKVIDNQFFVVNASSDGDGVAKAVENFILTAISPDKIPIDKLNYSGNHALIGNLGIRFTSTSKSGVEAVMPVDERTRQPFGILHGGATLALAETVAGLGSMILCNPDETMVGMQVSGNHISSAREGDMVHAEARIIHKGRSSHVWNVDIFAVSTGKLVSSVRVVNSVMKMK